jgi:hypothetical protein
LTNAECSPVQLYKTFIACSKGNPKPRCEIWYYKKAMGWKKLGNVVKKIMKKAAFDATRLYDDAGRIQMYKFIP